ncbi:MAG: hypothetical protein RIF33_00475 [Cyclobacteriaceae bacterium]
MKLLWLFLLLNLQSFAQPEITHKTYDTEFGRFDLWFHGDQLSGTYEIEPKEIIGSVWATLDDQLATGRWIDPDGQGDIILMFEEGFEQFRADYRGDDEPDKWYRDQWHGTLKPAATASEYPPCSSASHQLIQPFVGTWLEYEIVQDGSETFIGTLEVRLGAGGCSLLQQFHSPDSSFFYSTQGFVDVASGFWEETYVFSTARISKYQWIVEGGDIVQRRIGGSRSTGTMHQLRFTEVADTGYIVVQETSEDGGRNWIPGERTRVKRK